MVICIETSSGKMFRPKELVPVARIAVSRVGEHGDLSPKQVGEFMCIHDL